MTRGISFQIPNSYDKHIAHILSGIDPNQYVWRINEDEVYRTVDFEYLFSKNVYSGKELQELISAQEYYAVFLNLQGYMSENDIDEINSYEDFLNSKCKIIVLVADNTFVDIYAKDINLIETIHLSAKEYDYTDISYITDQNDMRSVLRVL